MKRRRQTYAEAVKRATLSFKSPQIVDKLRDQMRSEGYTEDQIEERFRNVRVLPDEETERFLQ